ncbi:MAG: cytochrome c oxidase subunit II [Desulfobacteraceae bacterium]|nr:MAG: cytochrome c oxidase subunit II [Desulfobacteraceae bacterium]
MNDIVNPLKGIDLTFIYIIGFSLVLLVGVTAAMIFFVFRYRRSNHPEPADIRGNWMLETAWTVIPTLIVLSMFYFGWQSYIGLRDVPPGAVELTVYGQQFSWIIDYPNGKQVENEMVVPVRKPVKLNVTSLDVIHSLFIPAYKVKVDAVKGMETYLWFFPDKEGEYEFFCTVYCGVQHSEMNGTLRVVSETEYEKWLNQD